MATHVGQIKPNLFLAQHEAYGGPAYYRGGVCTAYCDNAPKDVARHEFYDTTDLRLQSKAKSKYFIESGAAVLHDELTRCDAKDPVVVSCHAGMNRSGAVMAAYSIGYLGWEPARVIKYLRTRNLATRDRSAITNHVFEDILMSIEPYEYVTNPRTFLPPHLATVT